MTRALAVLDTNILVLLLTKKADDSAEEVETERRREAARDAIREMQPKYRFGIPSVVVAELSRSGAPKKEVERLVALVGRLSILALTFNAGCVAAIMAREALSKRGLGKERGAVKFDTLICATAVAHAASRIVTEDPRDFAKYLAAAGASIEVVVPSEPPEKGQIKLLHIKPKKKK